MKKERRSYVIFGISKFGRSVAEELTEAGMHVLAVDRDEEKVSQVADSVDVAVVADVTDPQEVESLGLESFDAAIVATTGNLAASVMGVILAKEAGIPLVLAKASDDMQAKVFERLGADRVIIPEKESAARVSRILLMEGYRDLVELSDRVRMAEIALSGEWGGRTLRQLELRSRRHLNVVAVRKDGDLVLNWDPDEPLPRDGSLVVVGDRREFDRLDLV